MSGFPSRRAALFLRILAERLVPQNKISEIIEEIRMMPNGAADDFTGRERSMASMLGPSEDELDAFLGDRIKQFKEAFERARNSEAAVQNFWRADTERAERLERENRLLREAFATLNVDLPVFPDRESGS